MSEDYRKRYIQGLEDRMSLTQKLVEKDEQIRSLEKALRAAQAQIISFEKRAKKKYSRNDDVESLKAIIREKDNHITKLSDMIESVPSRTLVGNESNKPKLQTRKSSTSKIGLSSKNPSIDAVRLEHMMESMLPWPQIIKKSHPGSLSSLTSSQKANIANAVRKFLTESVGEHSTGFFEKEVKDKIFHCIPEVLVPQFLNWFDEQIDNGLMNRKRISTQLKTEKIVEKKSIQQTTEGYRQWDEILREKYPDFQTTVHNISFIKYFARDYDFGSYNRKDGLLVPKALEDSLYKEFAKFLDRLENASDAEYSPSEKSAPSLSNKSTKTQKQKFMTNLNKRPIELSSSNSSDDTVTKPNVKKSKMAKSMQIATDTETELELEEVESSGVVLPTSHFENMPSVQKIPVVSSFPQISTFVLTDDDDDDDDEWNIPDLTQIPKSTPVQLE